MELHEFEAGRNTISTKSGEISYVDLGTGPAAVFVHGVGSNAYLWRHVIGTLAGARRCLAVDLPLHGRSPVAPGQDLSVAALATVLADFCYALGLDRVDLVANDTGGAVAQVFAARHPEWLATLTLTNCDTADNLPPEEFKPVVELAKAGALAPAVAGMLDDLGAARDAAFGTAYEHPGNADPAGHPRLPGAHDRHAGAGPGVRAAAGRARPRRPAGGRAAATGLAGADPGGLGNRRPHVRRVLGVLAAGHDPRRDEGRHDRRRAPVLPRGAARRTGRRAHRALGGSSRECSRALGATPVRGATGR